MYGGVSAEGRRAERRARLLQAGAMVVRRTGLTGAGVKAIAAESGLSERYFYESFATVDELLAAIFLGARRELHQLIIAAAEEAPDPESAIRSVVGLVVDRTVSDPLLSELAFTEVSGMPTLKAGREQMMQVFTELVTKYGELHYGRPPGDLECRRRQHASVMAAIGFLGVLERWAADDLDLTRDEMVEYTADLAGVMADHVTRR